MPDEQNSNIQQPTSDAPVLNNPGTDPIQNVNAGGPGGSEAGIVGIILLALYLILFTALVIYSFVKIWPAPTPSRENPPSSAASPSPAPSASVSPSPSPSPAPSTQQRNAANQTSPSPSPSASPTPSSESQRGTVKFFWWDFQIWDEQRLLLLVILGGALGTLVHSLRSVYWYVGNRSLVRSWIAMYCMLPFAGPALALVFYLLVRGGFFSLQSSFQQTSPFGFAAFSALIGMFSSQAVLKLKDVAEVLLAKP